MYESQNKYRNDIDGLRTLAVFAVVIYHGFPSLLKGGFTGVDVFFVISGFLMTKIILTDIDSGIFSIGNFMIRRVCRLFPALLFVLVSTYLLSLFVLFPSELKSLSKHIIGSLTLSENFILLKEAGYFDQSTHTKPLMHMWSLSVEEQFYLFLPLFFIILKKYKVKVLPAILCVFFFSFFINLSLENSPKSAQYFNPLSRFWEMLAGSLVYLFNSKLHHVDKQVRSVCSIFGLMIIISAFFIIDQNKPFPHWYGLFPVLGTCLIIFAGPHALVNNKLFSISIISRLGKLSYPLYLWHWPLLTILKITSPSLFSHSAITCIIIIISIILSWFTHKYIEIDLKKHRIFGLSQFQQLILASLSVISLSAVTIYFNGFDNRYPGITKILLAKDDWIYPGNMTKKAINNISYYTLESKNKSVTLFIGDSNIEQYYPRVQHLISKNPHMYNSAIFKTVGGCFPLEGFKHKSSQSYCDEFAVEARKIAHLIPEVDKVVISAFWIGYLILGHSLEKPIKPYSTEYYDALETLKKLIHSLSSANIKVFLVLNIPFHLNLNPISMITREVGLRGVNLNTQINYIHTSVLNKSYGQLILDLSKAATQAGADIIDPTEFICTDVCSSADEEGPIYKDHCHLNARYVKAKAYFIDKTLKAR